MQPSEDPATARPGRTGRWFAVGSAVGAVMWGVSAAAAGERAG